MNQNSIHDRIFLQRYQHTRTALTKHSKELHNQALGLRVIENIRVIGGSEDELEAGIIDDVLNLSYVQVVVDVIKLEAKLEVLIVEDTNLSLRIVLEYLDHSSRID